MPFRSWDDLKGLPAEQLWGRERHHPIVIFIQDHTYHSKAWGFLPLSRGKNKLLEQFAPILKSKPLLPLYVRYKIPEPGQSTTSQSIYVLF